MPEIGFCRSDNQRMPGGTSTAKYASQGAGFNRITQRRARAMRLDVVDLPASHRR